MRRLLAAICVSFALCTVVPARAAAPLDDLARDVERTEAIRAVKTLQSSYAQYAQAGLWNELGGLFATHGSLVFDGLVKPAETARGPKAVATFLRNGYGGGYEGLKSDGLSAMFIDSPVVNLAVDGASARARWQAMIFHGHAGKARIEGGVFVNDYIREAGVWKFAKVQFYPQYDGP